MKKWIAITLMALMMWTPLLALATTAPALDLNAQIEATLKQYGYASLEDAMKANGVDTIEALAALAMTGKLVPGTAAASEDAPAVEERSFDGKVLATMEMEASAEEIQYFFQEQLGIPIKQFLTFPTVNEALLALKTGKVDTLLSMNSTATYMAQQDETLYTYMDPRLKDLADISLSMVVLKASEALGLELNEAIHALEADGTLMKLAGGLFGGEPPAVPEAKVEGEPLRVGVTGDIPPVDYVDASGNPTGYNVNLMNQVGALLGRPIEFVLINKAAAITSLMTGRIDILFWQEQALSEEVKAMVGDLSNAVFITDPYLKVSVTAIELK